MAKTYPIQANFTRGEASPKLHARVDIEFYKAMLKTGTNWTIMKQGGLRRRPGFMMVKEVKDSTKKTRLIPFIFGTPSDGIPQAYVLEFGNLYARILTTGGIITDGGGAPTAITKANPGVVTLNGHGFINGDRVYATGIGGMVELNNREFTVANKTANTFELSGINTTSYTTFTSGGLIKKIVEIATSYLEADLFDLDYAQSADKLTVTHLEYQSQDITRTSEVAWTISDVVFRDGPYLDEPANNSVTVDLSASGAIHPKMTGLTAPSGTAAASDAGADAWEVFDQAASTTDNITTGTSKWWSYEPASSVVCNSYWIKAGGDNTDRTPSSWAFQGFDGSAWVDLDRRSGESSWGGGEVRFYDFVNAKAFSSYRLISEGTATSTSSNGSSSGTEIAEMGWGYNGDYGPTVTATFSGTTGINDGVGFENDDIGRNIRLRGADGNWRYFVITGVTSSTVVTGRLYGYAFPNIEPIARWRLGSFREGSWPSKVGYYQSRRVFARSIRQPYNLWLTQTFAFTTFTVGSPVLDSDAIDLPMLTGKVNGVTWLADAEQLAVGTTNNVRLIGKANANAGFGATNFDHQTKSFIGTKAVKPIQVNSVLVYADFYGRTLREFVYDLNTDGYVSPDISILSDHLLNSGIVEMAYQQSPDNIIWIVVADGSLIAMTYDREQKIVGFMPQPIAIGDTDTTALVESVCSIPGVSRDEVYIIVKRTLGGVTKRYIEKLATEFDYGSLNDAVVGLDSAMQYSGSATGTITGLFHLAGRTVNVLADGTVFRGLTVSATGSITLTGGSTAAKWSIGLPYSSIGETLELATITPDGVHLGRRTITGELYVSVLNSLGLKITGISALASVDVFQRDNLIDPPSGAMVPRSGLYNPRFDDSWRNGGSFRFFVDDPLPCMVRGFIIGAEGEP
jgi:hypothetical protein